MLGFAMINSFRKVHGAVTLIFALTLIILSTLIIIFAANFGGIQDKSIANQSRSSQAFNAADAGLEFGINYLQQNYSTIVATASGGYINYSDSSTTNVSLANGSKFSVVYTNPTASNYTLITITSTGSNSDSTSTHVVSQQVYQGSILSSGGNNAIVSKGNISLSGNVQVKNTNSNQTVQSAGTITFNGNSETITSAGVASNSSTQGSDIQQNVSSIANESTNTFFANYFGTTNTTTVQNSMAHVYTNSASTDYSSTLNGMTGTSIWINQNGGTTASLSGNTVVGSASNPVLLIVNGPLSLSGNVSIYGFVFVLGSSGTTILTGNDTVNGALITSDNTSISGNAVITYNPSIINTIKNYSALSYFAKVPGSWKDF
jgi:Tfp pilus assembly protein PilX